MAPLTRGRSHFAGLLLAIVVVALGVRVSYVAIAKAGPCHIRNQHGRVVADQPTRCLQGDELFYNAESNFIANGHGFNQPYGVLFEPNAKHRPAADHPPLTVLVLAPVSWLSARPPMSWMIHEPLHDYAREDRYAMVVLGTILVGLVGLLGRRVGGETVGLVAAGIAAITPNLWVNDGLVMSETVTGLVVVGALLCAFALWDRPTLRRAAALGMLCGLCALARVELILFVVLLAIVVPATARVARIDRGALAVAAVSPALLVMAPWVAFNLARFHDPAFISTNDGITLAGANCAATYSGVGIGLWTLGSCTGSLAQPGDESQQSTHYRKRGIEYIKLHKSRLPVVVLARVGRTWSLFRPADMIAFNAGEDRERWVTRLGLYAYYPTLVAAIGGAVALWRRRARGALWVLSAPAIVVTVGAVITYGQTRFRAAAEPSLALLAAVGIVAAVDWTRKRRRVVAPDALTP